MRAVWVIPVLASILILGTIGIPQTFAQLCPVTGCITDNIYVSDSELNAVLKYDSAGSLLDANFITGLSTPRGIAFDSAGNLYVVNLGTGTIRQYESDGTLIDDEFITGLSTPVSVVFDSTGNLYVGDLTFNALRQYTSDGTLLDANFAPGLNDPQFIAFDSTGKLYISESGPLHSVRQYTSDGTLLNANFAGFFIDTRGIAFDSTGKFYVADNGNNLIKQFTSDGTLLDANFAPGMTNVASLAFDSTGKFYAADPAPGIDTIRQYSSDGTLLDANFITGLSFGLFIAFDTLQTPDLHPSILSEVQNIEEKLDGDRPSLITQINDAVSSIANDISLVLTNIALILGVLQDPNFGLEEIKEEVSSIEENMNIGATKSLSVDVNGDSTFIIGAPDSEFPTPNVLITNPFDPPRDSNIKICVDATSFTGQVGSLVRLKLDVAGDGDFSVFSEATAAEDQGPKKGVVDGKLKNVICREVAAKEFQLVIINNDVGVKNVEAAIIWNTGNKIIP